MHHDLHECDHDDCDCFWCRVSRKERFETSYDTMTVTPPRQDGDR